MTPRRLSGEAGLTLVELLVTVAIMGIAFGVLVGGMGTAVLGSDLHRKQADVENILRSFAETVKSTTYRPCASTADYQGTFSARAGYTAKVTAVEFAPPPYNAYVPDCHVVRMLEPDGFDAATTTFANPTNAYVIDEAPEPLTADASLQVGTASSASITLSGFGSGPAGSTLTVRVAHREGAGASAPTVSVDGAPARSLTSSSSLHEDTLTLAGSAVGTVRYEVSLASGALTASDSLDGIWVQVADPAGADPGLQRVSLEVKADGRPVTQDVQVVIRRRQ